MAPDRVSPTNTTETTVYWSQGTKRSLGKALFSVVGQPAIWIPTLLLIAATVFFRLTDADLTLSRWFFAGHGSSGNLDTDWPNRIAQPWTALYDWGIYPAWVLGCGGLATWVVSFFWGRLRSWRDPGLFFTLMLIIGPGVIVNGVFKPYWGRPRPHSTIPFGGKQEFLPVFQKGCDQDNASFPCGHASMGFYLMAPAFVFYRRRPRLAAAFLCLGLIAGFTDRHGPDRGRLSTSPVT